ncbi:MAG: hypothetical protein WD824_24985 [Cyclobacteriaceae bacterium]
MPSLRIKEAHKLKDSVLKELTQKPNFAFSDISSLSKKIGSDFNTTYVLCKELESEGYVEISKTTISKNKDDLRVKAGIKGKVFIKNGGYVLSLIQIDNYITKEKAIAALMTLIGALFLAYVIYLLGWN